MSFEHRLNKVLTQLFGTHPDGDRRVWFHWQNLNEDHRGNVKGSALRHGRCWFHVVDLDERRRDRCLRAEWVLGDVRFSQQLTVDPIDHELMYSFSVPGVSLYLGADGLDLPWLWRLCDNGRGYGDPHTIGIRIFDWSLWWSFWENDHAWSRKDPWWSRGRLDIADFFGGRRQFDTVLLEEKDVGIPMPEGTYPAHCKLEKLIWRRPRWFTQVHYVGKVDVPQGIPHEGKGENSWDCGEDRTYGISCPAKTYEEAIAHLVRSVLNSRRKYDGNLMATYPAPKLEEVDV